MFLMFFFQYGAKTIAAMLDSYFKFCEGCDYGNKPIDMPFQSQNVIGFSSPFAALRNRSACLKRGVARVVRPAIEHAQDVLYWWVRPVMGV